MNRYLVFLICVLIPIAALSGRVLEQTPGADRNVMIPLYQDSTGTQGDLATGKTIAAGEVYLSKNGGVWAAKNDAGGCTEDGAPHTGFYQCPLDSANDLDTAGTLEVLIVDGAGGSLPIPVSFVVHPTQVYDSLYGTDNLDVELADTATHGGSSFVLTGDRIALTSTSGTALYLAGQGTGYGLHALGGATNAPGALFEGNGTGPGASFTGDFVAGTGGGINAVGYGTYAAITANSGTGNSIDLITGGATPVDYDGTELMAAINAEADTALTDYDPPTDTEMDARTLVAASYFDPAADTVATVTDVTNLHASAATSAELAKVPKSDGTASWNATALAAIEAEADDAIELNRLDEFMVETFAAPAVNTLIADLTEDDAGTQRFTTNALENAPAGGGGDATEANQTEILARLGDETAAASTGDPGASEAVIPLAKQLVNVLVGTTGVATFPASAAPGNGVSMAEVLRATYDDTDEIVVDTSTTLDNYVDDLEIRLGTPSDLGGGATVAFNLSDIEAQTDDIGAAGAGLTEAGGDGDHLTEAGATGNHLTAVPWNAAWDAQVQSEVDDGLVARELDHLVNVADADDPADNSIVAKLVASDGDWSGFTPADDAQEAIRDRGDAAWTTGSGTGLTAIASGTAQAATGTTIQLATGETFADNELVGALVHITGGTNGVGQHECITDYTGATDTATVTTWETTPTGTITYEVVPAFGNDGCPATVASAADSFLAADCSDASATNDTLGAICSDWEDAGRLDAILDARMAEASINTTAGAVDTVTTTTTVTNDVGVNEWNGVALSTTNPLPNAAADGIGGLVISDAGGLDIDQVAADTAAIVADTGTDGVVLATDSVNSSAIATTGADEIRDTIITADQQITVANGAVDSDLERIEGQLIGGTLSQVADNFTQFYNITPTTTNTVDDVGATAATDWTAGEQNQMRQALGLTGTTAATTGTGEIDLIFDEVANLDGDAMRGTDSAATAAALSTHDGKLDTVDTNVDAVLVDTGTTLDGKINTIDTNVDAILVDTSTTLNNYVDDLETRLGTPSNLGTGATLAANTSDISGKVDTVDANVDSVLVDTGTTLDGKINTVDANVDAVLVDTGTTLDGKINTIDSNVDSVLVDTGTTLDGKINTVDSNVDAVLVDTADMQPKLGTPAGLSMSADIASVASDLTTVDGNVDAVLVDTGTTLDGKINTIDTNVDSVLTDTGTTGVVAASGTVDTCTNITQVEGVDATDQIRDAVAAMVIEGTMPLEDVLAIILARQVGTVTRSGDTYTIKEPTGTTTRITFNVSGTTRSNVVITPP